MSWRASSALASAAASGDGFENLKPWAWAEIAMAQQASKIADDLRIASFKM
jgi:hypothetical protein